MRRFELHRNTDVSGISGTGVVAEGIEFTSGRVVMEWLGSTPSVVVWASIDEAMAVHGHGGFTEVAFYDVD